LIVRLNGYPITTHFAQVDQVHRHPHQGIDIAMPMGTPISAVGDGVVTSLTDEGSRSFGKAVHVHMTDGNDAIYAHLSRFNVESGQTVHQGDVIGYVGSTGHSTGPHLHLQVMHRGAPVNPISYFHSTTQPIPWWDVPGHIKQGFHLILHDMWVSFCNSLNVVLPTLCCIGVLWWMVPFAPKSDKAPKLIGTSALVYMFYVLIRGAYQ
jgi:hypothetical protein